MYTIVQCTYIYDSLTLSDGHLIDLRVIDEKGLITTEVRKESQISIDTLEYQGDSYYSYGSGSGSSSEDEKPQSKAAIVKTEKT